LRGWAIVGVLAMAPFQAKIVHARRKRVNMRNTVTVLYEEIAEELAVSRSDVQEALMQLKEDGFFPGSPSLSTEQFCGRLPS
jgi:hypothetical protein